MNASLAGKVAIVTGSSSGIGRATALRLADDGAAVCVVANHNAEGSANTVQTTENRGGRATFVQADVGLAEDCDRIVAATLEAFGRIDILINNAGITRGRPLPELEEDLWDRVMDTNLKSAYLMSRRTVPHMLEAGGGAVVNVSTMASVRPFGGDFGMEMGYAVAKGGLNTLSKYMAKDLGRYGIRVNTCRMGWIHGAPVEGHIQQQVDAGLTREAVVGAITADIPIGIIPPEDDCARAVLMMISDFSRVVTGASLDVNGGHWMAP